MAILDDRSLPSQLVWSEGQQLFSAVSYSSDGLGELSQLFDDDGSTINIVTSTQAQ